MIINKNSSKMIFDKKDKKAILKNLSIYFKNNLYYNRRNAKSKIKIHLISDIIYLYYSIIR